MALLSYANHNEHCLWGMSHRHSRSNRQPVEQFVLQNHGHHGYHWWSIGCRVPMVSWNTFDSGSTLILPWTRCHISLNQFKKLWSLNRSELFTHRASHPVPRVLFPSTSLCPSSTGHNHGLSTRYHLLSSLSSHKWYNLKSSSYTLHRGSCKYQWSVFPCSQVSDI